MKFPLRLVVAHVQRKWLRTLLTLGSVFVAIFTFGLLQAILAGFNAPLKDLDDRRLVVESAISLFAVLPKKLESDLASLDHVAGVSAWTWYGGTYKNESPENMFGRFGVDPEDLRRVYGSDISVSDEAWKAFIDQRTACLIGEDLAADLALAVGSRVPIVGSNYPGRLDLEVVGVYRPKSPSFDAKTLFFHWDYMNEVSKQSGGPTESVSTFTLLLDDPASGPRLQEEIDATYANSGNRTRTLTERAFQAQFNSMVGNVTGFFSILSVVVLVACVLMTANTLVLNARERVREVGILKGLGFTPLVVAVMALIEGLLICVLGGGVAVFFLMGLDGRNFIFWKMAVTPTVLAIGLGTAGLLGLVSASVPAIMAWRLRIVDALSRRA